MSMPSASCSARFCSTTRFYIQAAGTLEADDFSLEKHRRIFKRMGESAGARREDRPHHRRQRADEVQRARSLRRPELPGLARRRPAADSEPRQLHPHRQGQGRAAAHHLRLAAHDEPLPAGRGGAGRDPGRAPKRRCSSWARRASRPGCSTPHQIIEELRRRHQRLPRSQQAHQGHQHRLSPSSTR